MSKKSEKNFSVRMVKGLLGFEEVESYELKEVPGNPVFFWLESKDGPNFLLAKPDTLFPEYKVDVKEDSLQEMANQVDDIEVYVIVTVPAKSVDMTANLLAPLLINEKQGTGLQVVLHDSPYTTRHHLFPPEKRRSCG